MARTLNYFDGYETKQNLTVYTPRRTIVDPGELMTDIYGLDTVTTVWKLPCDAPQTDWPVLFSAHPIYPWTHLERRRVQNQGGYLTITADYAGVNGTSVSVFELCVGVQDEPIVSHPNFVSAIGGKPSAPLNGAVFLGPDGIISTDDETGQFAYFKVSSNFAGIESYLAADFMTWRQRFVTNQLIYSGIGRISSPGGPAPAAVNWLLIPVNYEQRGVSLFVTIEWRAGGRRGWNPTIYG